jgi:translation initiation factor IF-2
MAAASWWVVVWFHVWCPANSRNVAEKIWVDVKNYKIIYQLIDDMKLLLTWMLKIEEIEKEVWVMKIKWIFFTKKKMMIIWWIVSSWFVQKDAKISLFRDWEIIWTSFISNLKSFKDDVNEVKEWNECWLQLNPALDIKEWDEIKITVKEKIIKKLELKEKDPEK